MIAGLNDLNRATSHCVHFVAPEQSESRQLWQGFAHAHIDYIETKRSKTHIANALALSLQLQHAPYDVGQVPYKPSIWVPFIDDLITLSTQRSGLIIEVSGADQLASESQVEMFDLIEAFLIQFHHWFEQKKPCHLVFRLGNSVDTIVRPETGRK